LKEQRPTKLVIPSLTADADRVLKTVLGEIQAHGYGENAYFGIRLALEEALSNAIHHGNGDDPAKHVTVDFTVTDDQAQITVCDEGCGFCPEHVPDPTLEENIERPNGRGVMLMRAYMTEVRFNDRGNCVTLVKHRNCPLPWPKER
jgi:serine/threonine-protein kinase RsbW